MEIGIKCSMELWFESPLLEKYLQKQSVSILEGCER